MIGSAFYGVRILDLTVITAGPVGTMLMGDLGAEVIKIEEPSEGDYSRSLGTVFLDGESSQFLSQNRNKLSCCIDLKKPEGKEVFLALARTADVITENFRPGTTERLGIGYQDVKQVKPDIIYARISAFGRTGPYADEPGNDPIVQAISGVMDMTGDVDGGPVRLGVPLPDFAAGALMAFGVASALIHRQRTGQGQSLDLSLLSATLFSSIPRDGEALRQKTSPARLGSGHPTAVPYRNFQGSDGSYFFVACITDKFWLNLCDALGRPDLGNAPRYRTHRERTKLRAEIDDILAKVFATKPAADWLKLLKAANVPVAIVNNYFDALTRDPQVLHNNAVVTTNHPQLGLLPSIRHPIEFSGTPASYRKAPPLLGEDTIAVLEEAGYSATHVNELFKRGVVGRRNSKL
jgi:crotonobetainyl-CoA:carnitine CoA-transferase CaiB-like acyl-CoA transferase